MFLFNLQMNRIIMQEYFIKLFSQQFIEFLKYFLFKIDNLLLFKRNFFIQIYLD
jgi:hypothetical protein